jgi:CRISPR type III-A-associated protein Csm2
MVDKRQGFFQGSGQKDRRGYQDSKQKRSPGKEPEKIIFRNEQNRLRRELLVEEAEGWANRMAKRVSYTQLRKFYSESLALKSKMEEKDFEEVEALVGMLISKANYSKIKSRFYRQDGTYENEELFNFIDSCVRSIHSKQDFNDFVMFFEAVLGFYPRKN